MYETGNFHHFLPLFSHSYNFRQLHNDKINMKIFAASIIVLIGAASAFTAPTALKNTQVSALRRSENAASISEDPVFVEDPLPKMSQSMPFMVRPAALTGTLAGDVGFDPFGFAKSEQDLMNYREAEIKHARLAMLVSLCVCLISPLQVLCFVATFIANLDILFYITGSCRLANFRAS